MNSTAKILLAVVVIQTAAISWLIFDKFQNEAQAQLVTQNLENTLDEKAAVEQELQSMLDQYESLKTNNAEVNAQLEEEQARIKEIMMQLKYTKRSNLAKIKELEKETETLRSIMRSYIKQVDSLNTKNKELTAENINVRKKYANISEEKEEIISQRDSLTGRIKKASILRTYSISASALNKRNKITTRVKKMQKIQVCFTLGQNVVAQKGKKNVYIRIAGPDGAILRNKESGMFNYDGSEIAYSSKREIDYKGNELNICLYWSSESAQAPGYYSVNIFGDGYDIGQGGFTLK